MVADDPKSKQQRVVVNLKVKLKLTDRAQFEQRFAQNISRTGIFIRANDPVPVGSRVKFEYRLADDTRVMRGMGLVRWIRTRDQAAEPMKPPGMGVEFVDIDAATDDLVTSVVARYGEGVRAPRKARRMSGPVPLPGRPISGPITRPVAIDDSKLDSEETDALAALGDLLPPPRAQAKKPAEVRPARPVSDTISLENELPPEPVPEPPPRAPAPALQPPEIIIDLCSADITSAGGPELETQYLVSPTYAVIDEAFGLSEVGVTLPHMLSWVGPTWPHVPAIIAARRLGIDLMTGAAGEPAFLADEHSISIAMAIETALAAAIEPYGGVSRVCALVPAHASAPARAAIHTALANLGVTETTLITDAEAVLAASGVALEPGRLALTVQLGVHESRVALLSGPSEVAGARVMPDAGISEANNLVFQLADVAFLRAHGLDINTDPAMFDELVAQTFGVAYGDTDLELAAGGGAVLLGAEQLIDATAALSDRIALTCDALLNERNLGPGALAAVLVYADGTPWPGLLSTLGTCFGLEALLIPYGTRIGGAAMRTGRRL